MDLGNCVCHYVGKWVGHCAGLARKPQIGTQWIGRTFVDMEVIQVKMGQQLLP